MVATRRGAQSVPENAETASVPESQTLRKKPVRKTAKPEPKRVQSAVSQRTTRSIDSTNASRAKSSQPKAAVPTAASTSRANTLTRSRGAVAAKAAASKTEDAAQRIPSRQSKTRELSSVEKTTEPPVRKPSTSRAQASKAPTQASLNKQTRAARAVKPPLSPKKITQVTTKPAAVRTGSQRKTVTAAKPIPAGSTRRTRGRVVSDENVPLPDTQIDEEADSLPSTVKAPKTPPRSKKARSPAKKAESPLEPIMSSRSTTPDNSDMPDLDRSRETLIIDSDPEDEDDVESEVDIEEQQDDSEDELAGPKTPMRRADDRTSRSQSRKLASVEPATSTLERLQDDAQLLEQASANEPPQPSPAAAVLEPDEVIASNEAVAVDSDPHASFTMTPALPTAEAETLDKDEMLEVDMHEAEQSNNESVTIQPDTVTEQDMSWPVPEADPFIDSHPVLDSSFTATFDAEDPESFKQSTTSQHEHLFGIPADITDPDETIVIEEEDIIEVPNEVVDSADSSLQSVVITRHEEGIVEDEEMPDIDDFEDDYPRLSMNAKTPRPPTVNWNNIQQNEEVAEPSDTSPALSQTQAGIMSDVVLSSPTKREIELRVREEIANDIDDQTIEFSEFVTMPAVTEPASNESGTKQESKPEAEPSTDHQAKNVSFVDAVASAEIDSAQTTDIDTRAGELANASETVNVDAADELDADHTKTGDATPSYMRPTAAFDARRKSMPSANMQTPVKSVTRPNTSDGASFLARPFEAPWWSRSHKTAKESSSITKTPPRPTRVFAPFTVSTPRSKPVSTVSSAKQLVTSPYAQLQHLPTYQPHTVSGPVRFQHVLEYGSDQTSQTMRHFSRSLLANRTPVKARTPLRTIADTPGFTTITPHPAMPLRGVVAIVEVYTLEGASASTPFVSLLHRLGAKTTKVWGDRVTHVIFKDGSPTTLQKIANHNKRVADTGIGHEIFCINSRWISACDVEGTRVNERDEDYAVDTQVMPASNKRKRKSMEPATFVNVGGSLVRDRKSSWGRSSSGRILSGSLFGEQSPATPELSGKDFRGKENANGVSSPSTPAWIAAPESLTQATAPVKRVRRLEPVGYDRFKARRRTELHRSMKIDEL